MPAAGECNETVVADVGMDPDSEVGYLCEVARCTRTLARTE